MTTQPVAPSHLKVVVLDVAIIPSEYRSCEFILQPSIAKLIAKRSPGLCLCDNSFLP